MLPLAILLTVFAPAELLLINLRLHSLSSRDEPSFEAGVKVWPRAYARLVHGWLG